MRRPFAVLVVGLLLLAVAVLSLGQGDVAIAPGAVFAALADPAAADPATLLIVREVRLPRLLLALLVGGALGLSGALAQAVLRNPLAEPGLLGINGGAALAATVVMMAAPLAGPGTLPVAAALGALLVAAAIYALAGLSHMAPIRLTLIGLGFGALTGGLATGLSSLGEVAAAQRLMAWLAGSVYDSTWPKVTATAAWLLAPLAGTLLLARELDHLVLGARIATGLGQRVGRVRLLAVSLCALLAAVAVAAAGPIAFVGLVAPHLARRLVGHDHLALLPMAGLAGALIVAAADLAGRGLWPGIQLPAGLVVPILAAPAALAMLVLRVRR